MLEGFKALLNSEKAIASGVLMVASTIFVLTGKMAVDVWVEYTQVLLGIYIGGKTIQGVAANLSLGGGKGGTQQPPPPPPPFAGDSHNLDGSGASGGKSGGG